jgi:hypothetical protein
MLEFQIREKELSDAGRKDLPNQLLHVHDYALRSNFPKMVMLPNLISNELISSPIHSPVCSMHCVIECMLL